MLRLVAALLPLLLCLAALLAVALAGGTALGRGTLIAAILIAGLAAAALALALTVYSERQRRLDTGNLVAAARRLEDGQLADRLPAVHTPELQSVAAALAAIGQHLHRARQEAETERQRFTAVLGRSADGVLAIDGEGSVRYVNAAARRLLGIPAAASFEPPAEQSFVAAVRDHELAALLERCRREQAQVTGIVRLAAQGRDVEAIFLPLQGAGGWRYLGLLHDLTEIRRGEGQRRDLVSNLSHELRTPLASIKAAVQVLAEGGFEDDEAARELLGGVDHEVDRLTQLVDEMLELSRIESGQLPFQFEAVDAAQLCSDAVRRLSAQAERAGVALRWNAEPELPALRADPERLLRAVINLVHNAIKFTPAGGSVTVEARRHGGMGEIAVRDTGIGIPQAEQERIFERFYKVDRARSSTGTGLGLAIVKHTAQAHGGRVEVASSPGAGATFRLLIPFATDG
jgi:two-component system phosphate regulon sensor histidine kinase PhoR